MVFILIPSYSKPVLAEQVRELTSNEAIIALYNMMDPFLHTILLHNNIFYVENVCSEA
jgi:hypothetical protein